MLAVLAIRIFYYDSDLWVPQACLAEWSKALDLRSIVHLYAQVRTLQYALAIWLFCRGLILVPSMHQERERDESDILYYLPYFLGVSNNREISIHLARSIYHWLYGLGFS